MAGIGRLDSTQRQRRSSCSPLGRGRRRVKGDEPSCRPTNPRRHRRHRRYRLVDESIPSPPANPARPI